MTSAKGTILVQLRARLSRVWKFAAAAIVVLLACLPLFSQSTQGTIQGTATDQSGGLIAGATVTVIDVARGITRALMTDGAGEYVATNLTPGTYTVRAEAKGFRTVEHSGVLVEVGKTFVSTWWYSLANRPRRLPSPEKCLPLIRPMRPWGELSATVD